MYKLKKIAFIQNVAYCISIIFFMIVVAGCAVTALHEAIQIDDFETAKLYIGEENKTMCSAVNVKGWTPIFYTAYYDRPEITELLIKKGVNINKKTIAGWTPLAKASEIGNFEVVKLLVENGAKIDARNNDRYTPLMLASENDNFEIVKLLVENGAKIDAKTIDGWTPLLLASGYGNFEAVKLLIENGAKVDAKTTDGWTTLTLASKNGNFEAVKLLIENGVKIDARTTKGWTPLLLASYGGHAEIVKLLINKGADINVKCTDIRSSNNYSKSAIYFAAKNNHTKTVRYLIEAEADTNIIQKDAHDLFSTATISNVFATLYEEKEDSSKAIENYQIAARRFENAADEYKIMAGDYRGEAVASSIIGAVVAVGVLGYTKKHGYQTRAVLFYDSIDWDTSDLATLAEQCDKRVEISKQLADNCRNSANSLLLLLINIH